MKLYELTTNYNNLLELMDNPEVPQELITESLNSVSEEIEVKAENIAKLIKSVDADVKALKDEETRLATRRKTLENRITNLKEYLELSMKSVGKTQIKGKVFTLAFQKNPPSVNVTDKQSIPSNYLIPQEPEIDKKRILQELKSGSNIPGAELKQSESLRIR